MDEWRNGKVIFFVGTPLDLLKVCVIHQKVGLKVQPCKLYNDKYMIALTQVNNGIFAFLAFKLLSRKVLFLNRKDNRNW